MTESVIKHAHSSARPQDGLRRKLLPVLIAGCFSAGSALANPYGAQVVNGQVSISSQGNVLTVTNSPGSIINWQSFSIGAGELTRFVQQGASSTVLNRIVGQDPSRILGALQSNGRVFLVNPNGILFGQGAQVNVAGLVASTLNISNEDFLAGRMKFQAGPTAAGLQNQGSITTSTGGQIYLVAPNVENSGILTSPKGEVVLAAGHSVHLVDGANPDLHVVVSAPDNQALNLGQVVAEGGKIGVYGALIKQRGLVSADSAVVGENGKIVFKASKDTLLEAGSRTTATGAGRGGTVHVLGERVALTGDAKIDVSGQAGGGAVLVGGDYQGKNAAITNAKQTYLGRSAEIRADATEQGNGGKVILWADDSTRAYGSISARGGREGGNGGFVEVSGKQNLAFDARVDTSAPKGMAGTTLLDPDSIEIVSGNGGGNDSIISTQVGNSETDIDIVFSDGGSSAYTISENALESLSATSNVNLQATSLIRIGSLSDGLLSFQTGSGYDVKFETLGGSGIDANGFNIATAGGNIEFRAGGTGSIHVANIATSGGDVTLNAGGGLTAGSIDTNSMTIAGNVSLTSGSLMSLGSTGDISGDAIRLYSGGPIQVSSGSYINGGSLRMTAVGGIENNYGSAIYTNVPVMQVSNSGSGHVRIHNFNNSTTIYDLDSLGYGIRQTGGGQDIDVDGSNNINVNAAVTTSNGSIYVTAYAQLHNTATINTSNGDVDLTAIYGHLDNAGTISATSGDIDLFAGAILKNYGSIIGNGTYIDLEGVSGIVNHPGGLIRSAGGSLSMYVSGSDQSIITTAGSTIENIGGTIELLADKMSLGGRIDAGSGTVVLAPYTSSNAIHVGTGATDNLTGILELATGELNVIQAGTLEIGDGYNGDLTIRSALHGGSGGALEGITTALSLNSAGNITQLPGAIIAGASAVQANGADVNLTEANSTGVIGGEAFSGNFRYRTTNLLTVSNVNYSYGISAPDDKAIYLISDSSLGINQAIDGYLMGGQLVLRTPGPVWLGNAFNDVAKVAADLNPGGLGTGTFAMLNYGDVAVDGSFDGISGITTNNRDVEISVMPGYSVTLNQPINSGSGRVIVNSDGVLTTSPPIRPIPYVPSIPSLPVSHDQSVSNTVTLNSINVIVNATAAVAPQISNMPLALTSATATGTSGGLQDQEDKNISRAFETTADQTKSGVSKNEVAQKLYCN